MNARPEDLWHSRYEEERARADRRALELAHVRATLESVQAAADAIDARYQELAAAARAVCEDAEQSSEGRSTSLVGTDVVDALRAVLP